MPRAVVAPGSTLALITLALIALAPSPAAALGCNRRIVTVGDPAHYVREMCGEPASMTTRTETRTQVTGAGSRTGGGAFSAISVTVQIDVWIYDFGPRRFMEELTFENGVLRSLRTLGYGTRTGREDRRGALLREDDRALAHQGAGTRERPSMRSRALRPARRSRHVTA